MLDRPQLISAIESRLAEPACPPAFLLLVVLEDANGAPVANPSLVADIGRHLSAMTRQSDVIGTLDVGELAMVVFDLPTIQRIAFTNGIAMAINGVVEALAPTDDLHARLGTSPLNPSLPLTEGFRQADRMLRATDPDHLVGSGSINLS